MKILYSDNDIVVCIKPYGILSTLDTKQNMVCILKESVGGEIYPVHRLDRTTGGVMVFARNKFSAAFLSKQVEKGEFQKEYYALVFGKPERNNGCYEDLLFFDRKLNKSYVVNRERKGVKRAVLLYEVLESLDNISLVSITLKTGRTHQIRVQFSSRGYSLLGDRRYGSKFDFKNMGLWSTKLSFILPSSKERVYFTAEPQGDAFDYFNNKKRLVN